jgi:hypothetical protein
MPVENGAGMTIGEYAASPQGKAAMAAALGGSSGSKTEPNVYMGQTFQNDEGPGSRAFDTLMPVSAAEMSIYSWDDGERRQWGKRLYGAGLLQDPNDFDGQLKAWSYAVKQAAGFNNSGNAAYAKLTPWGVIDVLEQQGAFDQSKEDRDRALAAEARALRPTTSTSTSINAVPDRSDAEVAIKTLFREQLGRDPESGELDRYTSMMLSKMRADPGGTTTTSISNPVTGQNTSTSKSTAGFNPTSMLEDKVKGDPEWGAYQAATVYFNALQKAIGAPN